MASFSVLHNPYYFDVNVDYRMVKLHKGSFKHCFLNIYIYIYMVW